MSLIKPTIIESLFYQFFKLDSDRPSFYINLYSVGISIFRNLEKQKEMDLVKFYIKKHIEYKYKTDYTTLAYIFDNANMSFNRGAYIRIGRGLDSKNISILEVKKDLEDVKDLIQTEVVKLSNEVRFTRPADIYS